MAPPPPLRHAPARPPTHPPGPPKLHAGLKPVRPQATAAEGGSGSPAAPPVREVLDGRQRSKLNTAPDTQFYSTPRIVHHLDVSFRAQLTQLYRERIAPGAAVLDLCSSWVSHLPPEQQYSRVVRSVPFVCWKVCWKGS